MDVLEAKALTDRIYARLNQRRDKVEEFEQYYGGNQPLTFATEEWMSANAARYSNFSDNWCGTIVNAEAERLKPIGLTNLPKKGASRLWDQLQMNEFDAQFSQGAVTALTTGRAYVIVWDDGNGDSLVTFEHPSNVEVEYDWENPRLRKAALKTWVDEGTEFATLYTADQLFKWKRDRTSKPNERDSQARQGHTENATDDGWVPRFESDSDWIIENPLGIVPVVEISNRPTLKGDPISEIAGVVPMQNAINLLWAYLFLAADYASMEARVMLASAPPTIPIIDKATGAVVGSRPVEMKDLREKRLLSLTGDNARIDSWKAAQLDIFTDTIEVAVGHIAAQTRTPPHYLVSNKGLSNLSGDALVAAEIGLVQKSNEFITFTDPQLREVVRLVALVKNEKRLAEKARLAGISWQDREKRSESQLSDALLKKSQMGYPFEYLLEEAGKSPTEIERIMAMRKAEMDEALAAGVDAAVQSAMNDQGASTDVQSQPASPGASSAA